MKYIFIVFFCFPFLSISQDDLFDEIDTDPSGKDPVSAVFKGLKIVNFESTKLVAHKEFTFIVAHRFGSIENGIDSFFGLDDAVTRLNFVYGISEAINISVSRSSFQKIYEGAVKYRLVRQQENGFPFTLVGYNSILINTALNEAKLTDFEQLKIEKAKIEVELKQIEKEKKAYETESTKLKKEEELRIDQFKRSIDASNILQKSLIDEKSRLSDARLEEEQRRLEALKETWSNHEKDVENHIRIICKNNVISYIEQNDFPYAGKKPDNTIEILDQYIIFDAKSPANDDLNNFPKYIRTQTENLKKYAKHENVKNDLYLVIPSHTYSVIKDFTYNIGDYNVFIISKDSLEPIILSLKKIEEYEFADKLSPKERDNICKIIGKFAHTTKRKI